MSIKTEINAWVKKKGVEGFTKIKKPMPKVGDGDILVKVKAVGICGTDMGIHAGYREVIDGLIPGHEFVGEIIEIGEGLSGFSVGEYVSPGIVISCGHCWQCHNGYEAQCENLIEIGIHIDGAFAEYVVFPASAAHKVPRNFSIVKAASIEPVAVAYNIVKKIRGLALDKNVIIFGPGAIGLYSTQLLISMGFRNVIMVGTRESRLGVARSLGAKTINIKEASLNEEINKILENDKVDVVIEATGNPSVVNDALEVLAPHGQLVLAGIFSKPIEVSLFNALRKEVSISTAFCYTWSDFEHATKMMINNKIKIEGIVTDVIPLDEMENAISLIKTRQAIKVILTNE